ncbi:GDSL-type esterase/lipase family protein [Chitinasiproducens palmae]|uniref:Lysophospholipase L1 n=1 Tax=Chitinasiproducens palmae TaxID=1770053 RepID=A0A1H2PPS9_9BURK|nr:GDSL-type esterase/lipase family protein [Chitinasiproducens palmae]SDV48334.1 Lysophospholipase L1 [Chitinasiproducens palmae]
MLASAVLLPGVGIAATEPAAGDWTASWRAAPQAVVLASAAPSYLKTPTIAGRTVRQIVYSRLAGRAVRISISNRYGREPLVLDAVRIGVAPQGAGLQAGTDRPLRLAGAAQIVVPAGREVVTDAVEMPVSAGERLAVSFYIKHAVHPTTWHKLASQTAYVSAVGDHSADSSATPYRPLASSYFWLSGLDVAGPSGRTAWVAIGDSITDGMRSTQDANRRWPDVFAERIGGAMDGRVAVINTGISGNRLLSDSACYGEPLLNRFGHDALDLPNVKAVLVLIGINDINFAAMPKRAGVDCDEPHTQVDANALLDGYRRLIAAAHAKGLKIYGATLTPASLPPAREAIRTAVNTALRAGIGFDGIADFDHALADPTQVARLLPRYDSGDHIHPSDAGYAAMAAAVPAAWASPVGPSSAATRKRRH